MMNTKPSPVSAPTLYTSTLLHAYPRVTALADSIYSPAAYANAQGYLGPFGPGPDSSAFYAPLNADCGDAWRSLSAQTAAAAAAAAAWVYEPSMVGYPYPASYGNLDVRRKNATRESTSTLKAWLYEHIKNPYPTKGEKIMLAIITKMTLTQVSTWFANARRRLKKENKMQWSPRNRTGDDDDDDDDKNSDNDDVIIGDRTSEREENGIMMNDDEEDIVVDAGNDDSHSDGGIDIAPVRCTYPAPNDATRAPSVVASRPDPESHHHGYNNNSIRTFAASDGHDSTSGGGSKDGGRPTTGSGVVEKPRIWSLADVATSNTPSSGVYRQRSSPSASSSELLPVRTNDHLQSHHHRYATHDIPESSATPLTSLAVHHSFQPWTKRFLAGPSLAGPSSVHPFAQKLIPGYVPYLGLGPQSFRQDPCAAAAACNGADVAARSHAPTSAVHVAGAVVVGALSSPPHHRLEFEKVLRNGLTPDERAANPGGKYSTLPTGYVVHPSPFSSSSSSSSCSPTSSTILSSSSSSSSTSSPKSSPICSSAAATAAAPSSSPSCHPLVQGMMLPSASSQPVEKRS